MATNIPYVGPLPSAIEPLDPTFKAVVIICALRADILSRPIVAKVDQNSHYVNSMEHTKVTCPVTFAHPVIQLASAAYSGGASLAEK